MTVKRAVKKGLLAIVLALTGSVFFLVCWSVWYRYTDHTARLLAARDQLVSSREIALPDSAGRRRLTFEITDSRGRTAGGSLNIPDSHTGPLPMVLILAGHGTGARAVELVRLAKPAVLCGLNYPEIPDYRVGLSEAPGLVQQLDSLVLDAAAMVFTALDYLCSRPEVDTGRITVLGASFGVPFAVIAGLDERVDGMALLYGGAGLERVIEHNLGRKVKSWWLRRPLAYLLGTFAAPYEPGGYVGRFAPRPLLVVNSRDDDRMPEAAALELFEAAGEPKERVLLPGGHVHPSNTALIDSLTATVSRWLVEEGLL